MNRVGSTRVKEGKFHRGHDCSKNAKKIIYWKSKTNFSFSLGTLCKKVAAVRRATNYKQRTPMMNGWADWWMNKQMNEWMNKQKQMEQNMQEFLYWKLISTGKQNRNEKIISHIFFTHSKRTLCNSLLIHADIFLLRSPTRTCYLEKL